MMKLNAVEIIGWVGAFLTLISYGLLSTGIISGDSVLYHSLVLVGALGLVYITYKKKALQPLVVNAVFAFFAVIALLRILL